MSNLLSKPTVTFLDFSNPLPKRNGGKKTIHLGALYIIAAMELSDYSIDYRDYQTSEYSDSMKMDDMIAFADNLSNIVMISCMAYMLPSIILLSNELKKQNDNLTIILGGPGPAGVADKILLKFDSVDYIIRGEGEITNVRLLDYLLKNNIQIEDVPGIFYRANGDICSTPVKRIVDLDSLPMPAYHAIDMNQYDSFGLITGRGCMYKCKFCDIHGLWGNKYRRRSIEKVLDELELLVNTYHVTLIDIWDDTFTFDKKRVMSFANGIINRGIKVKWTCFGRVNLMDEELLSLMSKAGCVGVFYGIESGSQSILDSVDKKVKIKDIIRVIEMSVKYVKVSAHLIWGFPFESAEDLLQTIYLYFYLKDMIGIDIGQLWPYPTSDLYNEYNDLLKINDDIREFQKILPFEDDDYEEIKMVLDLIEKHSEVFAQYTVLVDDDYQRKKEMVEKFYILSE